MFVKGHQKIPGSGRKKGSLNKPKVPTVSEFLMENGVNPIQELIEIFKESRAANSVIDRICKEAEDNPQGFSVKQLIKKDNEARKWLSPKAQSELLLELLSYCHAKPKAEEDDGDDDDFDEFDGIDREDILRLIKTPDGAS